MKKTLTALACALTLLVSASIASALTLTYGDDRYLGHINDGVPAGAAAEVSYINSLLDIGAGAPPAPCTLAASELCDRLDSTLVTAGLADAALPGFKDESPTGTIDLGLGGFTWLLAKYGGAGGDQASYVWYVGGLTGEHELDEFRGGLSHISLYNPGTTTVPDGGAALGLLGLAMLGVGYLRTRMT